MTGTKIKFSRSDILMGSSAPIPTMLPLLKT